MARTQAENTKSKTSLHVCFLRLHQRNLQRTFTTTSVTVLWFMIKKHLLQRFCLLLLLVAALGSSDFVPLPPPLPPLHLLRRHLNSPEQTRYFRVCRRPNTQEAGASPLSCSPTRKPGVQTDGPSWSWPRLSSGQR